MTAALRVAFGADHAAVDMKDALVEFVKAQGHTVFDFGTHGTAAVDYPDYAQKVARSVLSGEAERGILLCGSGVGVCITANKVKGIRAGLCHNTYTARQAVEHDDIQVLALGARVIGIEIAKDVVLAFLNARFTGEERHARRLAKIAAIEGASE
jgi:ribose 5-phosphate isomerase B